MFKKKSKIEAQNAADRLFEKSLEYAYYEDRGSPESGPQVPSIVGWNTKGERLQRRAERILFNFRLY